jgi:hypothetical protein
VDKDHWTFNENQHLEIVELFVKKGLFDDSAFNMFGNAARLGQLKVLEYLCSLDNLKDGYFENAISWSWNIENKDKVLDVLKKNYSCPIE